MNSTDPVALTLDARGLSCPLPVIRAKRGIAAIGVGEVIEILTTDPGSVADFRAWTRSTGHDLIAVVEEGPPFKFLIRRMH
ncbi:MAG: sulfurtransferase TusA family protein [Thermaerobacter sp.]|nr:sulfurtransferase TusA family protein [Thermaerobacter sp.]